MEGFALKIQGTRGKVGEGFSLKAPNGKHYYVYVWKRKDYQSHYDEIKERRKANKKYNKATGWKSIGRYDNPDTVDVLLHHLKEQYGIDIDQKEIQEQLEKKYQEQEERRMERLRQKFLLNH